MKKFIMILLLGMMFALVACGKETGAEDVEEVIAEAESTEAPTPEPTEAPTPEPTEAPTPEPTEAPTPEPTEAPTPEPTEAPTPEPTEAPAPEPTEAPTPEPTPEPAKEKEENYVSPQDAIILKPVSFGSTDEEVKAKLSKVLSCSDESAAAVMDSCAMYGIDFTQMTSCATKKANGTLYFYVSTDDNSIVKILINADVDPYYVYHVGS